MEESPEYVTEKKQQKEQKERQEEQERIAKIAAEHQDEIDTLVKQKKKKALVAIVISAVVFVASFLLQLLIKDITAAPVVAGSMIAGIAFFLSFCFFEAAEDIAREEVVSKYR